MKDVKKRNEFTKTFFSKELYNLKKKRKKRKKKKGRGKKGKKNTKTPLLHFNDRGGICYTNYLKVIVSIKRNIYINVKKDKNRKKKMFLKTKRKSWIQTW